MQSGIRKQTAKGSLSNGSLSVVPKLSFHFFFLICEMIFYDYVTFLCGRLKHFITHPQEHHPESNKRLCPVSSNRKIS